jgi:uncharacterized protein (TIGR02646 family)
MIALPERPKEKPNRLRGRTVGNKKAALTRMFRKGIPIASKDFDGSYYSDAEVRRQLWIWQAKKCCYCERMWDLKRELDVEHFRPKSQITGEVGLGYWWLAYEWTNLFFSCKACNQDYKKTQFPLEAGGIRALAGNLDLSAERPTLVDFSNKDDDPEVLLGYLWVVKPEPLAKPIGLDPLGRGDRIIRILGLDRDNLNQERGALIGSLWASVETVLLAIHNNNQLKIDEASARIREDTSRGQTFVGFRRFFFRQHKLGQYIAND